MLLVIDANIVISALVSDRITDLIFSEQIRLIAPELLFVEIRKHKAEILAKSCFSSDELEFLLASLEKRILVIPEEEFISLLPEAEKILGEHKKDIAYVALALKFSCPVWSYEKRFKKVGNVESLVTSGVRAKLEL